MNEEKRAGLMSWGISVLVHMLVFAAAALAGLFLLVQSPTETEVVDVAVLPESGQPMGESRPVGGEQTVPTSSNGESVINMPDIANMPEIRETYTRDSEKQKEYRQKHHAAVDGNAAQPASPLDNDENKDKSGVGSAGSALAEATDGNGGNTGNGAGNGSSNGSGRAADGGKTSAQPVATERIMAVCTYRPDPVYPESLRTQGAEGIVQVRILVAADNSIEGVYILSSSGYPAMDQAALQAAWDCRFQMNGYLGRYTTTYRFALTGGDDW